MRIDNVVKSRQPLILAKEKNLLQAGRRRRGGVGQIGGVEGARSASCWNKRNSSACSEPNYFCPDDNSRFFGKTYLVNKLPLTQMTSVLWHRKAKLSLKTSAASASGELMGVQKLFTFPEKRLKRAEASQRAKHLDI